MNEGSESMISYQNGCAYVDNVALDDIGKRFGTPCYVYCKKTLLHNWYAYSQALADYPHLICYSVKANSTLAVLDILAKQGAGFDIVSQGELVRVLKVGVNPDRIVFSGVGKTKEAIQAALDAGIGCFNIESAPELALVEQVAKASNKRAPIALRVNPDVDAKTHPYIATGLKDHKFGINMEQAFELYQSAQRSASLEIKGIDCHIGSQLTTLSPFLEALTLLLDFVTKLKQAGIVLSHVNVGGGLGICYQTETPPSAGQLCQALCAILRDFQRTAPLTLLLEPGRSIVGNAGILLSQVLFLKPGTTKNFAIVDAAMNDYLRPALYQAHQDIVPVVQHEGMSAQCYDIVGPVCESGDFLGLSRSLALTPGDYIALKDAGAYGFSMSSNYNSRARAAEVMVDGARVHLIRERESIDALYALERCIE